MCIKGNGIDSTTEMGKIDISDTFANDLSTKATELVMWMEFEILYYNKSF